MEPRAPREYDFDMSWGEGKNKIDLREPIGNCYGLMALAVQTAERLDYSAEAKQIMIDDMNSWDYVHVWFLQNTLAIILRYISAKVKQSLRVRRHRDPRGA